MKITHEVQFSRDNDAFSNSRLALARLLENKGHRISDLKSDLGLINFQNLANFPEYLTSISHTKGAGAAALALKSDYLSLGIDIEWSDRLMKDGTQKFYRHPEDSSYANDLELWAMKEAAFKAISPLSLYHGVLVLSKIIIHNGVFWTNDLLEIKGTVETQIIESENKKMLVAIAYIRHRPID